MNQTINFNTDDAEELQKMVDQQNEENRGDQDCQGPDDDSFIGAF